MIIVIGYAPLLAPASMPLHVFMTDERSFFAEPVES
jgi:hypothetical protein